MGLFNFFLPTQPQNSIEKGRDAFIYFHNQATKYQGYDFDVEMALRIVAANGSSHQSPEKVSIFLDALGSAITQIQASGFLGGSGVKNSMEKLADDTAGRVPTQTSFFSYIGGVASNPSVIDIAVAVAPEVGSQIVDGAVKVGDSVIETGKYLSMILPFAVVGAVLYIGFAKTKRIAG